MFLGPAHIASCALILPLVPSSLCHGIYQHTITLMTFSLRLLFEFRLNFRVAVIFAVSLRVLMRLLIFSLSLFSRLTPCDALVSYQ